MTSISSSWSRTRSSDAPTKPDEIELFATLGEQDAVPRYIAQVGDTFMFKGIKLTTVVAYEGGTCSHCHFGKSDCYSNVLCGPGKQYFATDEQVIDEVTKRLMRGKA